MKKKILLISSILLTLSITTIIIFNSMDNKENNIISNIEKDKQVINSNMITMMYETESGSGIYEETKDTTWPESGYIFNENLSGCENGGELKYNSENNTVNLLSNSSDRCYVYFDKYDGVWIDNVSVTNVTGSSVTLDVSATSENGNITTYHYALNDSEEYQESTNNVITINDLNKLTEYNIKIYAIDNTEAKSNIYEINVSTTDESGPVINSVEVSNVTNNEFTITVNYTSNINISKYYFIIDSEDISFVSANNSYTFNNLNRGTTYKVSIYVKDINSNLSDEYVLEITTANNILLAEYIKGLYTSQGSNGIYYHTSSLANSAGDDSYRYAGTNPNNYVCFGSNETPCPSENLYRIIGVFENEIKLIRYYSYGSSYTWMGSSSTVSNTWRNSTLNTEVLNGTYLNSFNSEWQNKISTHTWKVGGMAVNSSYPVQQYYERELGNSSSDTTYFAKIGLMYVSDYGYAASNSYWTTALANYANAKNSNWLSGLTEWTISRYSYNNDYAYALLITGNVSEDAVAYSSSLNVRPVFYLNSNVQYVSGTGTQSDPIRIN